MGIQVANLAGMFEEGRTAGREDKKRGALAKFLQPARAGDKAATSELYRVGASAEAGAAETHASGQQKDAREQFGKASVMLTSLGNGPQAQQAYSQWRQHGIAAGVLPGDVPEQFEPGSLQVASAAAQAYGGASAKTPEQFTLAPGSSRYGPDGKLIVAQPFAPVKPDYQLYDGADGPSWIPKPTGGPASAGPSGGAPGVLDSAYRGAMGGGDLAGHIGGLVSPLGGRITSTTGGKHNVGSKHYSGGAVDIGMGRESPEQQAQILAALQADPSLIVRDERSRPPGQKEWSGPHLHTERRGQSQPAPGGVNAIPIGGVRPKAKAAQLPSELERKLELARQMGASPAELKRMVVGAEPKSAGAGGPKALGAEAANKVGLYDNAIRAAQKWHDVVMGKADGKFDGSYNDIAARTPQARALLQQALRAKLRAESGASISESEIDGEVDRYMGGLFSSDDTNVQKGNALLLDLVQQRKLLAGNGGGSATYTVGQVIVKGGKKYRVTDVSDPSDPDVEEVR